MLNTVTRSQGHDQGLLFKDQDKDKDLSSKDKDKEKDCIVKDKDQDKDCILVLEESLRTRTNITGAMSQANQSRRILAETRQCSVQCSRSL